MWENKDWGRREAGGRRKVCVGWAAEAEAAELGCLRLA